MIKQVNTIRTALMAAALMCLSSYASADLVHSFDFTAGTDGFTDPPSLNITGLSASGGFLTGTASSNDPQLKQSGLSITRSTDPGITWSSVVFRVQETQDEAPAGLVTAFDPTGVIVLLNNVAVPGISFTGVASGSGFFTVTADITGFTPATITDIRVDPIGGAASNSNSETNGNSFQVDYIRINDTSVATVPEPTTLAVLGLASVGMLVRRKKRSA